MRFAHCVTGHTCYVWCISKGETQMTRYFANSAATRKNRPLTTGMETEVEARAQAKFLADTYGGVLDGFDQQGRPDRQIFGKARLALTPQGFGPATTHKGETT
jgi:hypothetical protein